MIDMKFKNLKIINKYLTNTAFTTIITPVRFMRCIEITVI